MEEQKKKKKQKKREEEEEEKEEEEEEEEKEEERQRMLLGSYLPDCIQARHTQDGYGQVVDKLSESLHIRHKLVEHAAVPIGVLHSFYNGPLLHCFLLLLLLLLVCQNLGRDDGGGDGCVLGPLWTGGEELVQ